MSRACCLLRAVPPSLLACLSCSPVWRLEASCCHRLLGWSTWSGRHTTPSPCTLSSCCSATHYHSALWPHITVAMLPCLRGCPVGSYQYPLRPQWAPSTRALARATLPPCSPRCLVGLERSVHRCSTASRYHVRMEVWLLWRQQPPQGWMHWPSWPVPWCTWRPLRQWLRGPAVCMCQASVSARPARPWRL